MDDIQDHDLLKNKLIKTKILNNLRNLAVSKMASEPQVPHFFHPEQASVEAVNKVLMISCSDWHCNPFHLTQSSHRELLNLQTYGNVIPAWGKQGIEFEMLRQSLEVEGVENIIVCGHTRCQAMGRLLDWGLSSGKGDTWLASVREPYQNIQNDYYHLPSEDKRSALAEENVITQLDHLLTYPMVAARYVQGNIRLHGWMYDELQGRFLGFDPEKGYFASLSDCYWPPFSSSVES